MTVDPVEFEFNFPVNIQQLMPVIGSYPSGAFTNSDFGTVTAGTVIPVDVNRVGDRASTSGCEAADFTGLNFGGTADIALIQRGTCTFAQKAANAEAAGAEAVMIFNQGNTPDREGLIVCTLAPFEASIPVVGGSFDNDVALVRHVRQQQRPGAGDQQRPDRLRHDDVRIPRRRPSTVSRARRSPGRRSTCRRQQASRAPSPVRTAAAVRVRPTSRPRHSGGGQPKISW